MLGSFLEYRPDLAEAVMAGMPLNEAKDRVSHCRGGQALNNAIIRLLESV